MDSDGSCSKMTLEWLVIESFEVLLGCCGCAALLVFVCFVMDDD